MTHTTPDAFRRTRTEEANRRIAEESGGNWPHAFEISEDGQVSAFEAYAYRARILGGVFESLLVSRSVLVIDEATGVYPTLVHRAGARSVSASTTLKARSALIEEVADLLAAPVDLIESKLLTFYDGEPYVDAHFREKHEFALLLGQVWRLFTGAQQSFDAVVEACAFLVTDGLIFDWTSAEWAQPPPPNWYSQTEFCAALRRKFDYVTAYSDWLIMASGKLPPAPHDPT